MPGPIRETWAGQALRAGETTAMRGQRLGIDPSVTAWVRSFSVKKPF